MGINRGITKVLEKYFPESQKEVRIIVTQKIVELMGGRVIPIQRGVTNIFPGEVVPNTLLISFRTRGTVVVIPDAKEGPKINRKYRRNISKNKKGLGNKSKDSSEA